MGLFITFEGPEGSGKTTQIQLLAAWLGTRGLNVLTTREPGGTRIGDEIRSIVLQPEHVEMRSETEILLYSAARAQIVGEVIRPHLEAGGVVLCDRYAESTLAYQGYGRGLDLPTLREITAFATGNLRPDRIIYLDLPVAVGLRRKRGGEGDAWNRIESEQQEFHERVRRGYQALAAAEPERWLIIDGLAPVEVIQQQIREKISYGLGLPAPA